MVEGAPVNWSHFPLIWAVVVICWLIGGQCAKWVRRFVLPLAVTAYAFWANREPKRRKFALVFLALIGLLSAGYGEDSHLKRWCRDNETLTRLAMACLISSVFLIYSLLTHHVTLLSGLIVALNVGAWQVRAGSLGRIGRFDILIEDIARATACAVSLMLV
jgi:hypothetical protein